VSATWDVVWRVGTPSACSWERLGRATTRAHAERVVDNITEHVVEHFGWPGFLARAVTTRQLDLIGLPVGWDAESVDWERDEITYAARKTTWRMV
jgi:hypothetical protein